MWSSAMYKKGYHNMWPFLLLHVRQPPCNEQKIAQRLCCTFGGLQSPINLIKWYIYFLKRTVFRSNLKRKTCVLQALQKGLFMYPQTQWTVWFLKVYQVPVSQKHCGAGIIIRECEGIFREQKNSAKDNLKHSCPNCHCVGESGWYWKVVLHKLQILVKDYTFAGWSTPGGKQVWLVDAVKLPS